MAVLELLAVQQPPAQPATGLILGQIVDAGSGRPVSGAVVTLTVNPVANPAQISTQAGIIPADVYNSTNRAIVGADGRFVFRGLPAGRYAFNVTATGYVTGNYGQRRPEGPSQVLELAAGEKVGDATIRIWKFAAISGVVVDEAGEPVVGVTIRALRRTLVGGRWQYLYPSGTNTATDDRGAYRLRDLVPADYVVGVINSPMTFPMSVVDTYQQLTTSGSPAALQQFGRDAQMSGMPPPRDTGFRVGDAVVTVSTRGGVPPPPGDDGKFFTYPSTFYPAASSLSQATILSVKSGDDRTNVNLALRLVPTSRVSGTITGPSGPVGLIGVRLIPLPDDYGFESGNEAAWGSADARGAFSFVGVPPGQYAIRVLKVPAPAPLPPPRTDAMVAIGPAGGGFLTDASPGAPAPPPPPPLSPDPTLWASQVITVGDADLSGVDIALHTGVRVTGRLVFEGSRVKPTLDELMRMTIGLIQTDDRRTVVAPGRAMTDGQFSTVGYLAGRYRLVANAPAGWTMKSAMLGGRDISDEALELGDSDVAGVVVTFTDAVSDLSGTVRNAQNGVDSTAEVVVFSAETQSWKREGLNPRRAKSTRVTKAGAFALGALPAGQYYVLALASESAGDWRDPALLEKATALATRVTIADGEKKVIDLKAVVIK